MQLPMFVPESSWKLPDMGSLPSWKGAKRIDFDVETCDPQLKKMGPGVRRDGYVAGLAFKIYDGPGAYLPVQHLTGKNLPPEKVFAYLRDQFKDFEGEVVGANLSYDIDYAMENGIEFPKCTFVDVLLADVLLDENHFSYSLENVCKRHGLEGKDETLLREAAETYGVHPKSELYKLPPKFVGQYGMGDVTRPSECWDIIKPKLEAARLDRVWRLESDVLPILVGARRRGVRVDLDQLDVVDDMARSHQQVFIDYCQRYLGLRLSFEDLTLAEPLAKVLETIGVSVPRTAKSKKPEIHNEMLARCENQAARLMLTMRKANVIRNTFVSGVRRHLIGDRLHCTFQQLKGSQKGDNDSDKSKGAGPGRMSSKNLNLQNQPNPKKDPVFGPAWRRIFVPDEGAIWACCDYSQQEPRVCVHYAEKYQFPKAVEAANAFRNDPTTDNHQMMAELTGLKRSDAKQVLLARMYGQGNKTLCQKLGLPLKTIKKRFGDIEKEIEVPGDECQSIINRFNRELPYVQAFARACTKYANQHGHIRTLSGRRVNFKRVDGEFWKTYKATNNKIQGSGADIMKKAAIELEKAGIKVQLYVHDEVDFSASSYEEARHAGNVMRDAIQLRVPMKVDVEVGPNWCDIEERE